MEGILLPFGSNYDSDDKYPSIVFTFISAEAGPEDRFQVFKFVGGMTVLSFLFNKSITG